MATTTYGYYINTYYLWLLLLLVERSDIASSMNLRPPKQPRKASYFPSIFQCKQGCTRKSWAGAGSFQKGELYRLCSVEKASWKRWYRWRLKDDNSLAGSRQKGFVGPAGGACRVPNLPPSLGVEAGFVELSPLPVPASLEQTVQRTECWYGSQAFLAVVRQTVCGGNLGWACFLSIQRPAAISPGVKGRREVHSAFFFFSFLLCPTWDLSPEPQLCSR